VPPQQHYSRDNHPHDRSPSTYQWDAEGQRVAKLNSGGAVTEQDVYNTAGQVVSRYGPYPAQAWLGDEVWAGGNHLAIYANGQTYFPLTDQVGTERARFSYAGAVVETCMSQPFGDNLQCAGTDSSPYKFGKLERDGESGDDHAQHRDYNSNPYRWLTPDPLGKKAVKLDDPQTWNMYAYVRNNPTTLTDPTGLTIICRGDECKEYLADLAKATALALSMNKKGVVTIASAPDKMSTLAKEIARVIKDAKRTVNISADSANAVVGGQFGGNGKQFLNYNSINQISGKGGFTPESVTVHETVEAYQGLVNGNNFAAAHYVATQYENLVRLNQGLGARIGDFSYRTGTGLRVEEHFTLVNETFDVSLPSQEVTNVQTTPTIQTATVP
jgi:RHS repeat-associated protein